MHVTSLFQGLNVEWHNQDSNMGPPESEAKCQPLDHNAMLMRGIKSHVHIKIDRQKFVF